MISNDGSKSFKEYPCIVFSLPSKMASSPTNCLSEARVPDGNCLSEARVPDGNCLSEARVPDGNFSYESVLLHSTDPELPYRRRAEEEKLAIHYGQLKLLISEIYFLTLYGMSPIGDTVTVVYAGAAPGIHIPFLSRMFPQIDFHLYDPARFRIEATDKIHLYTQYFTAEDAQKWTRAERESLGEKPSDSRSTSRAERERILFISDIRSLDDDDLVTTKVTNIESQRRIEEEVNKNMREQEEYYKIIRPYRALLKMRLPYAYSWTSSSSYRYLNGSIFKQAFAPQTSTETRLVPSGDEIDYDIRKYESQMFHHNVIIREKMRYNIPVTDPKCGLTNDYDSAYTMFVLTKYLTVKMGSSPPAETLRQLARDMLASLNQKNTLLSLRTGPIHSTTKIAKCRQSRKGTRVKVGVERTRSRPGSSKPAPVTGP